MSQPLAHDPRKSELKLSPEESRWLRQLPKAGGRPIRLAMAASIAGGLLLLPQAWLVAELVDRAIVQGQGREQVTGLLLGLAAMLPLRVLLAYLSETFGVEGAEQAKLWLRRVLLTRLLAKGPLPLRRRASGAVAAVLVDQVDGFTAFLARYLPAMAGAAFLPVAFALVLLHREPFVGGLLFLTAPLIPLFMALVGFGALAASRRQAGALTRLSGLFGERLRGLALLKAYGRGEAEAARAETAAEELSRHTLSVLRIAFLSSAVLEFFAALGVAGVALYVGLSFLGMIDLGAGMSLATSLFCLLLAPDFYLPLRQMAAHYHDRANAKAAVESIRELLDDPLPQPAKPVAVERPAVPAKPPAGRARLPLGLQVKGLRVEAEDRGAVLDHLDLTLEPGERVAILGPSGCGKTTLLESLYGWRPLTAGSVLLNGVPLDAIDRQGLGGRVAYVPQAPRLFHGSLAANIALARPQASRQEVEAAAEAALVLRFAAQLPRGLDTPVGERGLGLSGGEIQRVALARLFLTDPDLVLLDEPTASLDVGSEKAVMAALDRFLTGRTLLMATHSLALLPLVDRSLRLVQGRLDPAVAGRPQSRRRKP